MVEEKDMSLRSDFFWVLTFRRQMATQHTGSSF